jgi:hypothetical protein
MILALIIAGAIAAATMVLFVVCAFILAVRADAAAEARLAQRPRVAAALDDAGEQASAVVFEFPRRTA